MNRLSSLSTIVLMISLPLFVGFLLTLAEMILFRHTGSYLILIICLPLFVGAVLLVGWLCSRLKNVWVDNQHLHVATLFRGAQIPLAWIERVDESILRLVVIVRLKQESMFGSQIIFTPALPLAVAFGPHPVTAQLQALARKASNSTNVNSAVI